MKVRAEALCSLARPEPLGWGRGKPVLPVILVGKVGVITHDYLTVRLELVEHGVQSFPSCGDGKCPVQLYFNALGIHHSL